MAGTGIAYPIDGPTGYTATQGRTAYSAALGGATAARPLGGFSGVRPGTPTNTVTATTTTWTAAAFAGTIDLHALATNGPYLFSFPSGGSGAVVAQIGTARQDIIWVRVDDLNTSDGSGARQVVIDYSANTLTPPARAFVIAIINNTAAGGGAPSVTWVAPYAVAAGGVQPVASGVRPASPYLGQYIDDAATGLLRYNGTNWSAAVKVQVNNNASVFTGPNYDGISQLIIKAGSDVVSPTAASIAAVVFTPSFPNGVISVVATPGDASVTGKSIQVTSVNAGGFNATFLQSSGSGTGVGSQRINWQAIGW
jgi:hypothetical protein